MKYIILRSNVDHTEVPFIFPEFINHNEMASSMKHLLAMEYHRSFEPISAGFISVTGECIGKSETLKLGSREEDSMIVAFGNSIGWLSPTLLDPLTKGMLEKKLSEK